MSERKAAFERFDQMGEAQVTKQVLMWGGGEQAYAFEWLKLRASEASARNEASQAEQLEIAREAAADARRAAAEAKQANTIARTSRTIAIIGSVLSILIAILSWLEPRH